MRISDWSSDVCSSDLLGHRRTAVAAAAPAADAARGSAHRHQASTSNSRLNVACSPSAKRPRRDSSRFRRREKLLSAITQGHAPNRPPAAAHSASAIHGPPHAWVLFLSTPHPVNLHVMPQTDHNTPTKWGPAP